MKMHLHICQIDRRISTAVRTVSLIAVLASLSVARAQICNTRETQKLLPSDVDIWDYFGSTCAISGDAILVGASRSDWKGTISGMVYAYRRNQGAWVLESRLFASDGLEFDEFGFDVACDGEVAVIGAPDATGATEGSGAVYVLRYDGLRWNEEAKLFASDGEGGERFGEAVAIQGDVVVVGVALDDDFGRDSGSAYVFRYDDLHGWREEAKLLASDGERRDLFGTSVAVYENRIAVGATHDRDGEGSVCFFEFRDQVWTEIGKAYWGPDASRIGKSLAMSEEFLVVGSDLGSGATAHVFKYDGTHWDTRQWLYADPEFENAWFAESLAIFDDVLLIGSPGEDELGDDTGAVYVFRRYVGDVWEREQRITSSDPDAYDTFGRTVGVSGDQIVVGAAYEQFGVRQSRAAYAFEMDCPRLSVSPTPLHAGERASFEVTNARPRARTHLAYTVYGLGSTFVAPLNITLDLERPMLAGNRRQTDGEGETGWTLFVPDGASGVHLWFQVAQFDATSNVVSTRAE